LVRDCATFYFLIFLVKKKSPPKKQEKASQSEKQASSVHKKLKDNNKKKLFVFRYCLWQRLSFSQAATSSQISSITKVCRDLKGGWAFYFFSLLFIYPIFATQRQQNSRTTKKRKGNKILLTPKCAH